MVLLGEAYTRRGWYEKGLQLDLRLTQLRTHDAVAWYNLACSYSLLNRMEESLEALRRSMELGYADLTHLHTDPDLLNLRRLPKFRQLLELFASPSAPKAPQPGSS